MPKPSVSARPDYRAARTRARRRSRRRRRQLRQGLLALVCCLLLARGAAFAAENALDALFLDEPAQQLPADTPASVSDRSEPPRLEPEGGLPAQTDAREALEDYLAQLPGRVSVLAVRPSDGLTVAWNEDEQYYAASLLKAPYGGNTYYYKVPVNFSIADYNDKERFTKEEIETLRSDYYRLNRNHLYDITVTIDREGGSLTEPVTPKFHILVEDWKEGGSYEISDGEFQEDSEKSGD